MKKIFCLGLLALVSCGRNQTFLITDSSVGKLQKNTPVAQLREIYAQDSVVNSNYDSSLNYTNNERILIFEKNGTPLLELVPTSKTKGEKTIESVQILDHRFTTSEGISLQSSFGEIKSKYPDLELEQTLKSLIVTPKGKAFYFVIDKSEVNKPSLGFSDKVSLEDIPSNAAVKYIMVNWN